MKTAAPRPDKLSEKLSSFPLLAAKQSGTYEPDEALSRIEESLTLAEYQLAHGFLTWVHATGANFGSANIADRYAEYLASR